MTRPRYISFLDGLRGLTALYVVCFHARWLLWEGFLTGFIHHPERYYFFEKPIVYLFLGFSFGHQAVMLFFVLSGFVIHLRYAWDLHDAPQTARFQWWGYIKRRARRIYPPLIFALLLTFLLDRIGMAANYPIYSSPTVLNLAMQPNHDPGTLLGNLTFLMPVYVQPFGMNAVLWSLKDEWWFYMLYPLFWWLSRRSIALATGIMIALFVLSFFAVLWPIALLQSVFSAMLAWWFGVLLADIYTGRIQFPLWKLTPLLLLLFIPLVPLFILLPPPAPAVQVLYDTAWAAAFTGLLALLLIQRVAGLRRALNWFRPLGDMSYTLYLIHFPILILMSGWLMSRDPNQALPVHVGWVFVGIGLCVIAAYAAHFLSERPFLRKAIRSPDISFLSPRSGS